MVVFPISYIFFFLFLGFSIFLFPRHILFLCSFFPFTTPTHSCQATIRSIFSQWVWAISPTASSPTSHRRQRPK
ncbi:hypothetical protein BKA57DRAFT_478819 [Linnemannia elongata]|nr:hypothetical protein BKA57DRAFT_478819 [Linnemannia elongata]